LISVCLSDLCLCAILVDVLVGRKLYKLALPFGCFLLAEGGRREFYWSGLSISAVAWMPAPGHVIVSWRPSVKPKYFGFQ
jgi:hypothetical protein